MNSLWNDYMVSSLCMLLCCVTRLVHPTVSCVATVVLCAVATKTPHVRPWCIWFILTEHYTAHLDYTWPHALLAAGLVRTCHPVMLLLTVLSSVLLARETILWRCIRTASFFATRMLVDHDATPRPPPLLLSPHVLPVALLFAHPLLLVYVAHVWRRYSTLTKWE